MLSHRPAPQGISSKPVSVALQLWSVSPLQVLLPATHTDAVHAPACALQSASELQAGSMGSNVWPSALHRSSSAPVQR
jgi:hypothetical protein